MNLDISSQNILYLEDVQGYEIDFILTNIGQKETFSALLVSSNPLSDVMSTRSCCCQDCVASDTSDHHSLSPLHQDLSQECVLLTTANWTYNHTPNPSFLVILVHHAAERIE